MMALSAHTLNPKRAVTLYPNFDRASVQYLPGKDGAGLHEDSIDSWHMITHSMPSWAIPTVLVLTGAQPLSPKP